MALNRRLLLLAFLLGAGPALASLVTDINWYPLDAYCAFSRTGQPFVYDDPETWRFVFFSQFDLTHDGKGQVAFIAIRSTLQQLVETGKETLPDHEVWRYRTIGPSPYAVSLTLTKTGEGEESSRYEGMLSVEGPLGRDEVAFSGDCGV